MEVEENIDIILDAGIGALEMQFENDTLIYYEFEFYKEMLN